MSEDSTPDDGASPAETGGSTASESTTSVSNTSVSLPDGRTFVAYVLAPAVVATVVYWVVADATPLETGLFGAVMVVVILAMDILFDTIPVE